MQSQPNSLRHNRGFSMLEVLISVVILSVGLLGVARFHSALVTTSGYNKARSEAMALAQQKIDEIRSYTTEDELIRNLSNNAQDSSDGDFPAVPSGNQYVDYDTDSGDSTYDAYLGTYAEFGRSWSIATDGDSKKVSVAVTWQDAKSNNVESVTLSTVITWSDPELSANTTTQDFQPLVQTPTGRAIYSDRTIDISSGVPGIGNEDGTYTYAEPGSTDVLLIDQDGNVLLELEDACAGTSGDMAQCENFVRISGRVYIEKGTDQASYNNLFAAASDVAYCSKGAQVDVASHWYFDYTCYIGGYWYGNIGVIQANDGSNKICVGDPRSYGHTNPPVESQRRIYRGMLSVDYDATDTTTDLDGDGADDDLDGIADDANGLPQYVSIGIHGGLELSNPYDANSNTYYGSSDDYTPTTADPVEEDYLPGHNFLVTTSLASLTRDECGDRLKTVPYIGIKDITTNATGDTRTVHPFHYSPDEFLCLNQIQKYTDDVTGQTFFQEYYEDEYDRAPYYDNSVNPSVWTNTATDYDIQTRFDDDGDRVASGCPFNPVDAPQSVATIKGSLYFTDASVVPQPGMVVNTSDDLQVGIQGNCTVTTRSSVGAATADDGSPDSGVFADYTCKVYHNFDDQGDSDASNDTGSGWTGSVLITPTDYYSCAPYSYLFDNDAWVTGDTGNHAGAADISDHGLDFNCYFQGDLGADLTVVKVLTSTDATPLEGSTVTFMTTVANHGQENATNVALTDLIPSGLTYVADSAVASQGTYNPATSGTGAGVWSIGTLLDGDSATLTWSATVDSGQAGNKITSTITNVTADQTDPTTDGDVLSADIIATSLTTANLQYTKTLASGQVNPAVGDEVSFQVQVTNLGGSAASNVSITDPIPAGLDSVTVTMVKDGAGTMTWSAPTWTIGTLLDGESATLTMTGTVAAGQTANTITNTITGLATAATPGEPAGTGAVDDLTESVSVLDWWTNDLITTISVDNATPSEGDIITFTISLDNVRGTGTVAFYVETMIDLNTITGVEGLTLLTDSPNAPSYIRGYFDPLTGLWGWPLWVWRDETMTLTLKATVDDGASALSQPIVVNTTDATVTFGSDPVPTGDGTTSVEINVVSNNKRTVTGAISYNADTSDFVTGARIYAVNAAAETPGTAGTCVLFGTAGSNTSTHMYSCDVEFDPEQDDSLYIEFDYARTICDYNAENNGSNLTTSGADEVLWLTAPDEYSNFPLVTNYPIIARDERDARPDCP